MIGAPSLTDYRDAYVKSEIQNPKPNYMLKTGEGDKERLNIQSVFAEVPLVEAMTKWQAEGLLGKDFSGKILLDFGCGTGSACLFLKKCFPNVKYQGIDLAADSIASAQDAYPNETFSIGNEHEQSIIHQADIIFVRFVVQHQCNPEQFLRNLTSQMKSGAKILFFEPYTNVDHISKELPNSLYQTRMRLTDYKFALGEIAGNQQNFAPKILNHLTLLGLSEVQEFVTNPLIFSLDSLRDLLVGSFNSMKAKLIEHNIATEGEIEHHITTIRTHNNVEGVYLGNAYILLATKL